MTSFGWSHWNLLVNTNNIDTGPILIWASGGEFDTFMCSWNPCKLRLEGVSCMGFQYLLQGFESETFVILNTDYAVGCISLALSPIYTNPYTKKILSTIGIQCTPWRGGLNQIFWKLFSLEVKSWYKICKWSYIFGNISVFYKPYGLKNILVMGNPKITIVSMTI